MKKAEFTALLLANTNKTRNIRTYMGEWISGAARVPDSILTRIGSVVALLQANLDNKTISDGETEGLMIYNFQPMVFEEGHHFCSMDMVVKPLKDIDNTSDKTGVPIQVVVDGCTTEVMNNSQAMMRLGDVKSEELLLGGLDFPKSYGRYCEFPALCCFVAVGSDCPAMTAACLLNGDLDESAAVQDSTAFDSWTEARDFLRAQGKSCQLIAEAASPRQVLPRVLHEGLSKSIIKVFDPLSASISITPNPVIQKKEAHIGAEVRNNKGYSSTLKQTMFCLDQNQVVDAISSNPIKE